jgi:AraC-like DNA-binding protein
MDVLADVCLATRLSGMVFGALDVAPPGGIDFDLGTGMGFHIVRRGQCWLRRDGSAPVSLAQGDVAILTRAWRHTLSDRPNGRGVKFDRAVSEQRQREHRKNPRALANAGVLCGAFRFDEQGPHPLLELLPPVLHLRADSATRTRELDALVQLLTAEFGAPRPGNEAIGTRLADLLFLYAVREWMATVPEGEGGWLGALRDGTVGRALVRMHQSPEHDWTIEELADAVGVSRSTLARRFRTLVGEPPLSYLTRWRMMRAAAMLRETDRSIARIASEVGYATEFSFHRTFKRERGEPAGTYRRKYRSIAAGRGA